MTNHELLDMVMAYSKPNRAVTAEFSPRYGATVSLFKLDNFGKTVVCIDSLVEEYCKSREEFTNAIKDLLK